MSDNPIRTRHNGRDGASEEGADVLQVPRFHPWRLLFGTLATPLAWFAQMLIGEALTAQACARFDPSRPARPPSWMLPMVIAVSVACLVLGVAGAAVAWRTVLFTRAKQRHARHGRARRVAELEWFLARVGALCSAIFIFGLLATDLAVMVVSPCGQW